MPKKYNLWNDHFSFDALHKLNGCLSIELSRKMIVELMLNGKKKKKELFKTRKIF